MKLKKKNGFTLIEAVVTISVLTIVVTMTTLVIANMVNIQRASSTQYEANEEIYKAYEITDEYVSFVSVNNSNLAFSYEDCTPTSLTFSAEGFNFSLKYLNNSLSYSCDTEYTGDNEYLKKANSVELKNVDSISFNYHKDINMLVLDITVLNRYSHEVFTVRTLHDDIF